MKCPSCETTVGEDSDFCPSCGELLVDPASVVCERHGTKHAVGVCIICSTPVCEKCAKKLHGRTFCPDHAGIEVEQGWALVYSSHEINDAELAKSVLEEEGFKVVARDFLPIGYVWDGAGDSSFSRLALKKPAKIFVHVQDFLSASQVLDEWSGGKSSDS